MKKKLIIFLATITLFISVGIIYYFFHLNSNPYVGIWTSQNQDQTLEIFKDGTTFLYRNSTSDDTKKISIADIGSIDNNTIAFSKRYNAEGCLDSYQDVEAIPEGDFLSLTKLYSINLQNDNYLTLTDVTQNDTSISFKKIATKATLKNFPNKADASNYQISISFNGNLSQDQIDQLESIIESIEGVASVTYISPAETWDKFKEQYFGSNNDASEEFIKNNTISGSFEISYKIKYEKSLLSSLEKLDNIQQISQSNSPTS